MLILIGANTMKCLVILQPFADLINSEDKTLEIMSWQTKYRGDIIICAGKRNHNYHPDYKTDNRGMALCIVELLDIIPFQKKHEKLAKIKHIKNHFAWVIKYKKHIPNIELKGQLGLFAPPTYLKDAVNRL